MILKIGRNQTNMSYMALYRKFRPQTFEDVKGQDHIVTTLKNQITADRIGHAYLFCGTRGTGKTTIAKIVAKAVNCEHPVDGSPCGECASCKAIADGTSMNVVEIDAASNNGVENIRELREEVAYSPTQGRYKVYIIDEVHMLSTGAFNALLKTLEEPPAYVIFILATTEVQKIPITILSRCQRYDFKRISAEVIKERLKELLEKEQVEAEDKALAYVAKAADGSMRDALSLLDQCIAFYLGQELTYEHVLDVLGAVDTTVFGQMFQNILDKNVVALIELLDQLIVDGRDLSQFVTEFIWYLRNLLLIKSSDKMEDLLEMSEENIALLKEKAELADYNMLLRYIRIFSDLANQIKYASSKRVLVEIALIKLCKPEMEKNYDSLVERIAQLEEKFETGDFKVAMPGARSEEPQQLPVKEKKAEVLQKAVPEEVNQVVKGWKTIVRELPGAMRMYLRDAKLSLAGGEWLDIAFEDEMARTYFSTPENVKELEDSIETVLKKHVSVKVSKMEAGQPNEDTFADIEQLINMTIEIEDK